MTDRLYMQISAGRAAVAALASGVAAIAAITAALLTGGEHARVVRAQALLEEQHKQHLQEAFKVFSEYADTIEAGNRGERTR